jgi:hypothetical protein
VKQERSKHARKMADTYRSPIEASEVIHQNRILNREYANA